MVFRVSIHGPQPAATFWATVSLSVLTSVGLDGSTGALSGSGAFQTLVGANSVGAADADTGAATASPPARLVTPAVAAPCAGGPAVAAAARPGAGAGVPGAGVATARAGRTTARATLVTTELSATKRPARRLVPVPAATRAWPVRDESETWTVTVRRAGVASGRERRRPARSVRAPSRARMSATWLRAKRTSVPWPPGSGRRKLTATSAVGAKRSVRACAATGGVTIRAVTAAATAAAAGLRAMSMTSDARPRRLRSPAP